VFLLFFRDLTDAFIGLEPSRVGWGICLKNNSLVKEKDPIFHNDLDDLMSLVLPFDVTMHVYV